ncbi:MAG: hypothetical protein ABEH40_07960 [Haloferacaceae archaeon]
MLDAEWNLTEVAEVALVEVSVHNPTAVDRRVRVENRLDGPTLPPRRGGVPERGWDADGYAGVVPAGGTMRLGFASPAPPAEPPVAVEDGGRAENDTAGDGAEDREGNGNGDPGSHGDGAAPDRAASAAAAVRLLDDAAPPADALPVPDADADADAEGEATAAATTADGARRARAGGPSATDADVAASVGSVGTTNGSATAEGAGREGPGGTDGGTAPDGATRAGDGGDSGGGGDDAGAPGPAAGSTGDGGDAPGPAADVEVPPPVAAWLAGVERRIDHGERLTDASVVEAAAVLDERGGVDAVADLPDRLAADEAALRALAERAAALAERAGGTDVPLAALRRLA